MSNALAIEMKEKIKDIVVEMTKSSTVDINNKLNELTEVTNIEFLREQFKPTLEEFKDSISTEIRELVDLKLQEMPAKKSRIINPFEAEKCFKDGRPAFQRTYEKMEFAYNDNTDVAGGRVMSNMPYHRLEQMNILGRQLATTLPAMGQGVIKLPNIDMINWAVEGSQPTTPRTPGGNIGSKDLIIDTLVSQNSYSIASLQDVPSLDPAIVSLMAARLGFLEQTNAVATLKADTDLTSVDTGVAGTAGIFGGLPTTGDVFEKLMELIATLESPYWGNAMLIVSRGLYGRMQASENTTLNFDPERRVLMFAGFPLVVIEQLETGAADGNIVAAFGDFSMGAVFADSAAMTIGRYEQTNPGAETYFGHSRSKFGVWDTDALVTLKVGA